MNTTFLLTGGAGRIAAAIPALEKYYHLNPKDDFKVLVAQWDMFFWSNPILQDRTFEFNQKGNFDAFIRNSKLVVPEPYYHYKFYTQQVNLTQAFDEIINGDTEHKDLKEHDYLYITAAEKNLAKQTINEIKNNKQKDKVIVFQPFGSACELAGDEVVDSSNRSISRKNYFDIVKKLSNHAAILYLGPQGFLHADDDISTFLKDDVYYIRNMIATISECNYFLGVDSMGQHIAKCFNKPGLILMGGTDERNVSYPNHFKFYRKNDTRPKYIPMRINDTDSNYANRMNDGLLDLGEAEVEQICKLVLSNLGKGKK